MTYLQGDLHDPQHFDLLRQGSAQVAPFNYFTSTPFSINRVNHFERPEAKRRITLSNHRHGALIRIFDLPAFVEGRFFDMIKMT